MGYKDKDGGFKSFGHFLSSVRRACDGIGNKDGRLIKATTGHMETGEDSYGGFLVPEQYADGIIEAAALEGAIVRPRARVFNTTSDSLKIRTVVDTDRSTNIFGGLTFTWMAEAAQKSGTGSITNPAIGQLVLTPHTLVGGCYVSNELEDDYVAFGQFMTQAYGAAVRFIEDYHFINGTGAGQPLGVMNSAALITEARQTAGKVVYEDLTAMVKRLLPQSWNTAMWLVNPDVMDDWLAADAISSNQDILDTNTRRLLGFPFRVTEKCQELGMSGDVILADWRHYAIADRGLEITGSRHTNNSNTGFVSDETFWRIVLRVDGQPTLPADITPKEGANDLGPFVALTDFTS